MNRTAILKSIAASVVALMVVAEPAKALGVPMTLVVRIDNVRVGGGPVRVALFDREHWLGETMVAGVRSDPSAASLTVQLNAPAGRYGIAAYQDLNNDGRLNRNIVGLPTEPVAFSNGAEIRFGPPSFDSAAFDVSADNAAAAVSLR